MGASGRLCSVGKGGLQKQACFALIIEIMTWSKEYIIINTCANEMLMSSRPFNPSLLLLKEALPQKPFTCSVLFFWGGGLLRNNTSHFISKWSMHQSMGVFGNKGYHFQLKRSFFSPLLFSFHYCAHQSRGRYITQADKAIKAQQLEAREQQNTMSAEYCPALCPNNYYLRTQERLERLL